MDPNSVSAFGTAFSCILGLIVLACTIFWIFMVVDVVKNESRENDERVVWLLIVISFQFIGALIYFFVRRPARKRMSQMPHLASSFPQ
jgi:hypothetical protein